VEKSFHARLVPVEVALESRGTSLPGSTPKLATLLGAIDQTLNMDFGKLSQGERVDDLPPFRVECLAASQGCGAYSMTNLWHGRAPLDSGFRVLKHSSCGR
jgi:hypothetical protein